MEKINKTLAVNMKKARSVLKISQAKLAELSGISAQMIRDIESGRRNPSFANLEKLAACLGVSRSDLLGEEAEIEPVKIDLKYKEIRNKFFKMIEKIPEDIIELAQGLELGDDAWDAVRGAIKGELEIKKLKANQNDSKKQA